MTALDLDAVKADLAEAAWTWRALPDETVIGEQSEILGLVEIGNSLVAEVERLRDLLARNHRAYLTVQGIEPDTLPVTLTAGLPCSLCGVPVVSGTHRCTTSGSTTPATSGVSSTGSQS